MRSFVTGLVNGAGRVNPMAADRPTSRINVATSQAMRGKGLALKRNLGDHECRKTLFLAAFAGRTPWRVVLEGLAGQSDGSRRLSANGPALQGTPAVPHAVR